MAWFSTGRALATVMVKSCDLADHKQAFLSPVFRPAFEYQTIKWHVQLCYRVGHYHVTTLQANTTVIVVVDSRFQHFYKTQNTNFPTTGTETSSILLASIKYSSKNQMHQHVTIKSEIIPQNSEKSVSILLVGGPRPLQCWETLL